MKISGKAAAKINLLLDLGEKFDDGYHGIFTIMQSVGLYDTITIAENSGGIAILSDKAGVPCDDRNTAYKAARLFFEKTGIAPGVDIQIEKEIPMQAGLGGGSADAAGTLLLLNELFKTGLSEYELCKIGTKVGADVPFCVKGGTALCQNIGEILSPLPEFSDKYIVIVKPSSSVSTKNAYADYDASDNIRHVDREWILHKFINRDYKSFYDNTLNVFEQIVYVPERAEIKAVLRKNGSLLEMMSGSGSAIYGIFESKTDANKAYSALKMAYGRVWLTEPVAGRR